MSSDTIAGIFRRILSTAATLAVVLPLLLATPVRAADAPKESADRTERLRLGERMYRDGVLPSGEPMPALIKGDTPVPGTAFSCVSCHLRSGIGSSEGQILSPPTNGAKLYKPYYQYNPIPPDQQKPKKSMMSNPSAKPLHRPAYTDQSLMEVIRSGLNPVGRQLNPAMPTYLLEDKDMDILVEYLKTLSAEHSPGVSTKEIRFATVIAGPVAAEELKEMNALLDGVVKEHNRRARLKNRNLNYGTFTKPADFNYPNFVLSRWELKGPANTWRGQLEEYYSKEPVFALLGGISASEWQPVHEFCEQHKIPNLFPVTDLPVISDSDWYTLYFSKGAYQEGESAARHLGRRDGLADEAVILQVVEDTPRARAVAAGFQEAWKELGRKPPLTVTIAAGTINYLDTLRTRLEQDKPAALLLWTSAGINPALEALAARSSFTTPVYTATVLLQQSLFSLPEKARAFTYISYPYRLEEGSSPYHNSARAWLQKRTIPVSSSRISTRLFSLTSVLLDPFSVVKRDFNPDGLGNGLVIMEDQFESLMHVKRNYYRDYLLDVIGMMADANSLDYERISFGPGQRYVSKGCYIVQLSSGTKPHLIKRSNWVVY